MIAVAAPHPNQVAQELTGRPYLSHSAISSYQSCSLRYYFRYVAGLHEDSVPASLVFGGAVHKAAEHHFRELLAGNPAPSLDELLAAYRDGWREHDGKTVLFGKHDDRSTLDELAGRVLGAFQASSVARPQGTILGIEEELRGEVIPRVPDMLARIDLLVDRGDCLVVTDLKTARSRWSEGHVRDSAGQLLLYHELAKPLAEGRPVRLEFVVITKAKAPAVEIYQVPADLHQLQRTKRIVERVWLGIKAGVFYPSPSPSQCPTCPFRRECQEWKG